MLVFMVRGEKRAVLSIVVNNERLFTTAAVSREHTDEASECVCVCL